MMMMMVLVVMMTDARVPTACSTEVHQSMLHSDAIHISRSAEHIRRSGFHGDAKDNEEHDDADDAGDDDNGDGGDDDDDDDRVGFVDD